MKRLQVLGVMVGCILLGCTSIACASVMFTDLSAWSWEGNVLYPTHNQPIQVELPGSVYAFGFDLGELEGLSDLPTPTLSNVVLSTGDVFAGPFVGNPFPTYAFFGFYYDLPIISLSIAPHALIEPILDNFTYAQDAVPFPEPSTLLLIGSGLLGLVANAWWNRRS